MPHVQISSTVKSIFRRYRYQSQICLYFICGQFWLFHGWARIGIWALERRSLGISDITTTQLHLEVERYCFLDAVKWL